MAKDLNKVMIIGRLGKDPEMRYTPGGSPVTTFSVAAGYARGDRVVQRRHLEQAG
jgi:single-stranded DNA-binding protein